MDFLRRIGWLGVYLLAAVGVVGCQPAVGEVSETVEEVGAPTVMATAEPAVVEEEGVEEGSGISEDEAAVLQAAAAETAEDVARTARGAAEPVAIPAADEAETLADLLPNLGAAPEINNEVWINSEPLRLEDLRGKVVLVEFWTFG